MNDTAEQTIARLRRTLLLLANNQDTPEQRAAAGRHLAALGAALIEQQREVEMQTETQTKAGVETGAGTAAYRVATLSGAAYRDATWTLGPGSYAEREQAEIASLVAMQRPGTLAVILEEVDGRVRAPRWFRYQEEREGEDEEDIHDAEEREAGAWGAP